MTLLVLVVDDEPDVEVLFRQQFRRDLRAGRFTMEFAQSGPTALERITDVEAASLILILSDINMPGMSGLELLLVVVPAMARTDKPSAVKQVASGARTAQNCRATPTNQKVSAQTACPRSSR